MEYLRVFEAAHQEVLEMPGQQELYAIGRSIAEDAARPVIKAMLSGEIYEFTDENRNLTQKFTMRGAAQ